MALYRILLVDDEEEIRQGIIRKIEWERLGFVVAGDAENGLDALEKAEHLHPDVVMTDIKMPFMNGLELGEKLRIIMPSVKMIIFSGFDDFEYAQKAIEINVAEYVLKPVNAAELTDTLKKLKVQLDLDFDEKQNIETLRQYYQKSLPVLKEQFLVGLLEGRISKEQIGMQARRYGLNVDGEQWAVALIRADSCGSSDTALNGEEELIPVSLKRTIEKILGNTYRFTDFYYSECIVVLAELDTQKRMGPLLIELNEACKYAEKMLNVRVAAGMGAPYTSLTEVYHSYKEAQTALDYSTVPGCGKAIYIGDIEPASSVKLQFDEHDEHELVNAIKMGANDDIRTCIEGMFDRLQSISLPLSQYRIYLMEITTALLKVMSTYDLSATEIFHENDNYMAVISSFHTPMEMKNWYLESCFKIHALIRRERVDSTKLWPRKRSIILCATFRTRIFQSKRSAPICMSARLIFRPCSSGKPKCPSLPILRRCACRKRLTC